jgi:hypothetical protein
MTGVAERGGLLRDRHAIVMSITLAVADREVAA